MSTCGDGEVLVRFIDGDGVEHSVCGKVNSSLLDVAHAHDIEIEGACGGELACSTCHVILPEEWYERMGEVNEKSEEEEDMLDLAWGLTDTSRLGCQCILQPQLDGITVHIPDETTNMM